MQSTGLALVFHHTQPPGTGRDDLGRAFERCYLPMIAALEDYPDIVASVHWSGPLLEWMEREAPAALESVLAMVKAGRLEVLGGLFGSALLPAVPERDAIGQVTVQQRWWKAHGNVKPRGAWLPHCAWDPMAVRVLAGRGIQYTVLEDHQMGTNVVADGWHLTEREGIPLGLFVADSRMAAMVPEASPSRILHAIHTRATEGVRCLTLAVSVESFGAALDRSATACFGGRQGWVHRFFKVLSENKHWLKLVTLGTAFDRMRPTGRVYPPASVSLPVAVHAMGGQAGAAFIGMLRELRAGESGPLAGWVRAPGWDATLGTHAEVNRLHKRMLRASAEVMRLRNALKEGTGEQDTRMTALQDATLALYRGQTSMAYVHGVDVGAQDAEVRGEAWRNILIAERLAASALGDNARLRSELVDADLDGRPEHVVRTPHWQGVVAPALGGSLVELCLWALPANLLDVRSRSDEPEHAQLAEASLSRLPAVGEAPDEPTSESDPPLLPLHDLPRFPPLRVAQDDLASSVFVDRYPRSSFLDRFLSPEATLTTLREAAMVESGDFLNGEYTLVQQDLTDTAAAWTLARDGTMSEGAALKLVRVQKRFGWTRDQPSLDVHYQVSNRTHAPLHTRFGIELNFGVGGLRGPDFGLEVYTGRRTGYPPRTVGLDAEVDVAEVRELVWFDRKRRFRMRIRLKQPAHLWAWPIETVSRSPRGMERTFQGTSVVFWWPIEFRVQETKSLELALTVETG
jgi:alpha-amylase